MNDEISDDELERRMRAALFAGPAAAPGILSEDEERVKAKLFKTGSPGSSIIAREADRLAGRWLGEDNARKLSHAKDGQRVRLGAVVVKYEWYRIPANDSRYSSSLSSSDSWRIERVTNGRREEVLWTFDSDELRKRLAELRRHNHFPKEIRMGFERDKPPAPPPSSRPVSKRKDICSRLGSFRP